MAAFDVTNVPVLDPMGRSSTVEALTETSRPASTSVPVVGSGRGDARRGNDAIGVVVLKMSTGPKRREVVEPADRDRLSRPRSADYHHAVHRPLRRPHQDDVADIRVGQEILSVGHWQRAGTQFQAVPRVGDARVHDHDARLGLDLAAVAVELRDLLDPGGGLRPGIAQVHERPIQRGHVTRVGVEHARRDDGSRRRMLCKGLLAHGGSGVDWREGDELRPLILRSSAEERSTLGHLYWIDV